MSEYIDPRRQMFLVITPTRSDNLISRGERDCFEGVFTTYKEAANKAREIAGAWGLESFVYQCIPAMAATAPLLSEDDDEHLEVGDVVETNLGLAPLFESIDR